MRRLWVAGVLLLAAACSRSPEPPADGKTAEVLPAKDKNTVTLDAAGQRLAGVKVETVELRSVPEVITATGPIANNENRTWRIGAITDGRVVSVMANIGDRVTAGQVLARIHSHEIHDAHAAHQKAVAELARANSGHSYAVRARDRAKRLYDLKAGSLQDWEHAETQVKDAQAAVTTAQSDVDRTRTHITEVLGLRIQESPRDGVDHQDEYIPIRSPAAGAVLSRSVTQGTVVSPGSEMFTISDLSSLWAMAEVKEEHLGRLRAGQPARVYVQAYGRESFSGRIGRLGDALDPSTRTIKVRIDVPNPGGKLKPEMYSTVEIDVGGSRASIFVPQEATQELRGENGVFVNAGGDRFEIRPVQLGRTLGSSVEVVRGIKAGERLATQGAFILKTEFLKASLADE